MPAFRLPALLLAALLLLAGCGSGDDGTLAVAWLEPADSLYASGVRLSSGAQHLRAATGSGLVALDPAGEVVPALAERWIITDDGKSFIFRLREDRWADGSAMSSTSVANALRQTIRRLRGTSLGRDLAPVADVRAMAGRVVEIRLSEPLPDLLLLLAQPELALRGPGGEIGPMQLARDGARASLRFRPPEQRGLPQEEGWELFVRQLELRASDPQAALAAFDDGDVDLVMGGTIAHLPLVDTGPLSRGTVRLDPVIGLFGIQVRRARGPLADEGVREGLAMALDRPALLARYNVGGWEPTTRLVAPGLPGDPGLIAERWADREIADLRAMAAGRLRSWQARSGGDGGPVELTIAMGSGPGLDLLLRDLAGQFSAIGIRLTRAVNEGEADLLLVDRIARYPDARWFLNQFHCSLRQGLCAPEADATVAQLAAAPTPEDRVRLLAEAEAQLTLANVYLPIGAPLRFTLVRGSVNGFVPNAFAFHPLPSLAEIPR